MFVKSDIRKIGIALEKTSAEAIYRALGEAGIVHLLRIQRQDAAMDAGLGGEEVLTRDIIAGIDYAFHILDVEPEASAPSAQPSDIHQDAATVAGIRKTLDRLQRVRMAVQAAADKVNEQIATAQALRRFGLQPGVIDNTQFIRLFFGTVTDTQWQPPETGQGPARIPGTVPVLNRCRPESIGSDAARVHRFVIELLQLGLVLGLLVRQEDEQLLDRALLGALGQ